MILNEDNIITLAPSSAIMERASKLATPKKWRHLAGNEQAVWGECKSSGATYFKTQFDLRGDKPIAKCNCSFQQSPCKHALGLMLLFAKHSEAIQIATEVPDWVTDFLKLVSEKGEAALVLVRTPEEEMQLAQNRLKSKEKRLTQMADGLKELEIWLGDLLRDGLASLNNREASYWEELGARMVSAKLGGIGRKVRNLQKLKGQEEWPSKMLATIAEVYLLCKGFQNLEALPHTLQQELLNVAGINFKKGELDYLEGVQDTWFVLGQYEGNDTDDLFYKRTWVYGENSQRVCLFLDFAYGQNAYENVWKVGTMFEGELVYYPSSFPMRVFMKSSKAVAAPCYIRGYLTLEEFADAYALAIAANPWLTIFPVYLERVVPVLEDDEIYLTDQVHKIKVTTQDNAEWKILALSAGSPIALFGEWNGDTLTLLSAIDVDRFILLKDDTPLPRPERNWGGW